ncbi:hypothetical protein [Streptomyces sp. C8S0]|uniref:hypothetical protein n=1 Tax=Streptomyces sp. C8S0 TaxID=2585716 RepID=UPI00125D9959|nr:hypothetical protein [Streptomyces sp. C8S0]
MAGHPRWKRSRSGGYVSYRENANSAQVKVHAILLVLAALLADSQTQGRVLILDELGNSLGRSTARTCSPPCATSPVTST